MGRFGRFDSVAQASEWHVPVLPPAQLIAPDPRAPLVALALGETQENTTNVQSASATRRQRDSKVTAVAATSQENKKPVADSQAGAPTRPNIIDSSTNFKPTKHEKCENEAPSVPSLISEADARLYLTRGGLTEYFRTQNTDRVIISLRALHPEYHYLFVNQLAEIALGNGERGIALGEELLAAVGRQATVTPESLEQGFFLAYDGRVHLCECGDTTYTGFVRLILAAGLDAEELIIRFHERQGCALRKRLGNRDPIPNVGDSSAAQAIDIPPPSIGPGSAVSQERFRPPDDIIRYFESVAKLENYTTKLNHEQKPDNRRRGGTADVYRVATTDNRRVAVKCIYIDPRASSNKTLKRTARELEVWSTLKHDNILPLLGVAKYDGHVAMVSTWMGLGSVAMFVRDRPSENRYSLSKRIAQAVVYLHSRDIIHGDIKGENVLMSDDGKPMLTDFGLTIMIESKLIFSATTGGGGTTRWMAPELFVPKSCRSKEADVYALGMTILEVLTGEHPFSEIENIMFIPEVVRNQRQTPRRPECLMPPSPFEDAFWEAMTRCWTFEPTHRANAIEVQGIMANAPAPEELDSWETIDFD